MQEMSFITLTKADIMVVMYCDRIHCQILPNNGQWNNSISQP